jgi:NAD(P)-dependent dehydrogenase (short-subunit alcohol dehydrogenase family)
MASMTTALAGRTALVTGGGRGIGRAHAFALAAAGAKVAVAARSTEEVASVAAEIDGVAVTADVSRPADVARMVATVRSRCGPVEILVNNAGVVWPLGRTWRVDADEWDAAVAINLLGAVRCIRSVLPEMLAAGYGRILNLSSGAASGSGMPSASAYSASKAALDMVTANLAAELAGTGVTINGVRPGTADTAMQGYMRSLPREQVGEEFFTRFASLHRDGQLTDPAVAARLAVALIATDRSGVTVDVRSAEGQALLGNGGGAGFPGP